MVRKVNKLQNKTKEDALNELSNFEENTYNDIESIKQARDRELEMDTAFYFSVIFNDREERDAFLNKYKIKLHDNFTVLSKEFIKAIANDQ